MKKREEVKRMKRKTTAEFQQELNEKYGDELKVIEEYINNKTI